MLILSILSAVFLASFGRAEPISQPETPPSGDSAAIYPEGLISIPEDEHFSKYIFVVGKKERTLWVYERQGEKLKVVEKFETDIGKNHGEKTKANDYKTPTGIYFLQKNMTQPEIPFNLYGSQAFTTDYPNIFDQREAKTGSGIWLHAVPDTTLLTRGSRGCVVVRNDVIKKLAPYVKLKQTPLVIYNEVNFLTFEQHLAVKKKYLEFFEKWRSSWESQDIDSYIRFYDKTFQNDKMNFNRWYKHKKRMRALYSDIKVKLSVPLIISNKDQVVMRTLQNYKSNLHEDSGEKTLHCQASPQDGVYGFKIVREDWADLGKPNGFSAVPLDLSAQDPKPQSVVPNQEGSQGASSTLLESNYRH